MELLDVLWVMTPTWGAQRICLPKSLNCVRGFHIWVVAKEMKIKECVCWKSFCHNTKTLCQRVPRAHYIVISKRAAPSLQQALTQTHIHKAGIRIFNIRSANFSLLFAPRIWQKQSSFRQTRVCVCAHESWALEKFRCGGITVMWVCILGSPGNKQRRKVSKAAYTHAHTSSTHKALLNFVLIAFVLLEMMDGLHFWWYSAFYISSLGPFGAAEWYITLTACARHVYLIHALWLYALFSALCARSILQLILTPLFQFIRDFRVMRLEKKSAFVDWETTVAWAQNAIRAWLWKFFRQNYKIISDWLEHTFLLNGHVTFFVGCTNNTVFTVNIVFSAFLFQWRVHIYICHWYVLTVYLSVSLVLF
jgi:hypothetical protein